MRSRFQDFRFIRATLLLSLTSFLQLPETSLGISSVMAAKLPQNFEVKGKNSFLERFQQSNQKPFQIAGSIIFVEPRRQPSPVELKQALETLEQTLVLHRVSGNRTGEADILNEIGVFYRRLNQYAQGLKFHQQALAIYQDLGNQQGEAETLGYIGNTYFYTGQYLRVEDLLRHQLESLRKIGDKEGEQLTLKVMRRYLQQEWGLSAADGMAKGWDIQERMLKGDISWQEILDITKLNLFINREIGDRKLESSSLHGMGWAYRNLGQYVQSLNFYQKALTLQRELYSEPKQLLLVDLGTVYIDLGQYELALETLQNSLLLKQQACLCHCNALGKIGFVYKELGQYDKALHYLQQALAISDGDSDQQNILNYLGEVYSQIGKYSKALEFYQKALENPPIAGEQSAKGFILNNIGLSHYKRGQYTQGLEVYRKALVLFRELNDRPGERITLSNIGTLLEKQNKPELAIVFYKEAVNITENIRQGLRELPLKEQETYTKSVANTYRSLADLLLSQGRTLEAQQVLELLKVQELRNFTRDTRAGGQNSGIATNSTEAEILKIHGTLIGNSL